MPVGTLCAELASESAASTMLRDRRYRSAILQPSCSQPQLSCRLVRRCRRNSVRCAASRQSDTQTQKFPDAGDTLEFQPEEQPEGSGEEFDWTAGSSLPPGAEELGLTRLDTTQFPDPLVGDVDQEYADIQMHDCVFLVAAHGNKLRLDDVRIYDPKSGQLSTPTISGHLPREPALYHQVPWVKEKHGDYIKDREDVSEVMKLFFIRTDEETGLLDLDSVVTLDAAQRSVTAEAVARAEDTLDAHPEDWMLVIRDGQLTIQLQESLPSIDEVVNAEMERRRMEAVRKQRAELREESEQLAADMEENEMEDNMDEDEFDEPDVPAVDYA